MGLLLLFTKEAEGMKDCYLLGAEYEKFGYKFNCKIGAKEMEWWGNRSRYRFTFDEKDGGLIFYTQKKFLFFFWKTVPGSQSASDSVAFKRFEQILRDSCECQ